MRGERGVHLMGIIPSDPPIRKDLVEILTNISAKMTRYSILLNKLHFLCGFSTKCSLIIRYFVVCGIEDSSPTDRTLNSDDEFEENHLTSSIFS